MRCRVLGGGCRRLRSRGGVEGRGRRGGRWKWRGGCVRLCVGGFRVGRERVWEGMGGKGFTEGKMKKRRERERKREKERRGRN